MRSFGHQVETQPCRADGVGLFDDQLAPRIEPRSSARERESDQQSHQAEDGAFDRRDSRSRSLRVLRSATHADPPPDLQRQQHAEKETQRENDGGRFGAHGCVACSIGMRFISWIVSALARLA